MESPASRVRGTAQAFTLIELLVVVAIIAALLAILLPSLRRARQQAQVVACMANLRSIGTAGVAYRFENDDYPWALPKPVIDGDKVYSWGMTSEFNWGGGMPFKTNGDWDNADFYGKGSMRDSYNVPPRLRPINPFIEPTVSWDAEPNPTPDEERAVPSEIPGFFRCPGDASAEVPVVGTAREPDKPDGVFRTWEFRGTSYAINWYWPYYYKRVSPGNQPPYSGHFGKIMGYWPLEDGLSVERTYHGLGRELLKNKDGRFASEFILFMENRLNFALEAARPPGHTGGPWASKPLLLRGWHDQQDHHTASFLDGHAQYRRFDTRYVFGTGWTIWPNKPWEDLWAQYNSNAPQEP